VLQVEGEDTNFKVPLPFRLVYVHELIKIQDISFQGGCCLCLCALQVEGEDMKVPLPFSKTIFVMEDVDAAR
jgi:hypothetical protein